jgi:hypothetical protein
LNSSGYAPRAALKRNPLDDLPSDKPDQIIAHPTAHSQEEFGSSEETLYIQLVVEIPRRLIIDKSIYAAYDGTVEGA